jgi:hypothetical protein
VDYTKAVLPIQVMEGGKCVLLYSYSFAGLLFSIGLINFARYVFVTVAAADSTGKCIIAIIAQHILM